MRVLVAFEDARSACSRAIARAVGEPRPGLRVCSSGLDEQEGRYAGFDPRVVV